MYFKRVLHLLAFSYFFLSAYVQTNDPDPEIWVTIYMFPALLSLMLAIRPIWINHWTMNTMSLTFGGTYIIYGAMILKDNMPTEVTLLNWLIHDEVGREFSGLAIATVWTLSMQNSLFKRNVFVNYILPTLLLALPAMIWTYVYFNEGFRKLWPKHCQSTLYTEIVD